MSDDYIFQAYITNLGKYNEGALVGEWVNFPTTPEEMQKVFERIGINEQYEEWFITDYDCPIAVMYDLMGEYESLDELNYLASKVDELFSHEQEKFEAAIELGEYTGSIKDLINLAQNLDCYEFNTDIHNDYDLGYYWVEESGAYDTQALGALSNYIDYEAFGRDINMDEGGIYTNFGYVRNNQDRFTEIYDGSREDIPDEYRVMMSPEELKFYEEQPVISNDELDAATDLAYDLDEFFRKHNNEYANTFSEPHTKKEDLADSLLKGQTSEIKRLLNDMPQDERAVFNTRLAEYEKEFPKNLYLIYQLKQDDSTRDFRFEPLERLHNNGGTVQKSNYDLVYSAELTPADTLESIYTKFNVDHPEDFKGHSLSVSDVVVFVQDGKETSYYCDSFGFQEVAEFNYLEAAELSEEQNYNQIDGQINNEPSDKKPSIREQLNQAKKERGNQDTQKPPDKKPPEQDI